MKQKTVTKLPIRIESIRPLSQDALRSIVAGALSGTPTGSSQLATCLR
jgi:hypothetical protein